MARKYNNHGEPVPVATCPQHGEYYADAADSDCPSCQDGVAITPQQWLSNYIRDNDDCGPEEVLDLLYRLAERSDNDVMREVFEEEMIEDGYIEED